MIFIVSVLNRANNFWNAGNGRGVRTCTSVLRLLGCYSLPFDASKKERSTQIFFLGRLFARVKKKKKFYDLKLKGNGGY